MSRSAISPVEYFPGRVILPDYLTMPQVMGYEKAILETRALQAHAKENGNIVTVSELDQMAVIAICNIVEKWELDGYPERITPDIFPGSPRVESGKLIKWLLDEIDSIYAEETEIPNDSRARPTRSRKASPKSQQS